MKRIIALCLLLAAMSHGAVSQEKSFIVVGDLHFDRLDLHDWTWLRANMPSDTNQIINYSKVTQNNFRDLITELAEQTRTLTPAVRGLVQLGDFQEGLAGSDANALRMAKDVLDSLRTKEFTPPWIITKGNHDITGPGSAAAYQSAVIPFIQAELGQTTTKAYYSYRVDDVQFFVMDCYDTGAMMSYLDTALANSTAKYKVMTTHMPVIPVTARLWHIFEKDDAQRETLLNLLARYKVLVLAGHLHKYSVVRRMTAYGPIVQIMVGTVINDRNDHADPMNTKYGGNLIDIESSFDPSSAPTRRAYLDKEAAYVSDYRMSDLAGYGVLTLNSTTGWKLKYYGGLGKVVSDSVNLSLSRLTLRTTGSGTVSTSPKDSSFMIGTQVTVTAKPALGWKFTGWTGGYTGTSNPATFVMDDDKQVNAVFERIPDGSYELRINIDGGGTVQRNPAGPYYAAGTQVTLTAMPNVGQKFTQWSGDTATAAASVTVTMNTHRELTALFHEIQTYTVKPRTAGMGSVTLSPAGGTYTEGATVALTAAPNAGWAFHEWTGDLKGKNNPDTLVLNGNKEVRALYKKSGRMLYELSATEDTYIRGGITYQGRNFNTDPYLLMREGTTALNQSRLFLKFDLSSVRGVVQAAWLKLYVRPNGLPDGAPVKAAAYLLNDDSWLEGMVKWSGAPAIGSLLDSTTAISRGDGDQAFDLTPTVAAKLAGSKVLSVAVKDPATGDKSVLFDKREGTVAPKLVIVTDEPTGVVETAGAAPLSYQLYHSYPNPFNPSTTIRFDVAAPGEVALSVYDMLGKQVASLVQGRLNAGSYQIEWDASRLSSAMYLVRLNAGGGIYTERVVLAK